MLPLELSECQCAHRLVILGCAAVVNVPVTNVPVRFPASKSPTTVAPPEWNVPTVVPATPIVVLPFNATATLDVPLTILVGVPPPPDIPVSKLPLPIKKLAAILPADVILPEAVINPVVVILPPTTFPVALNVTPVITFAPVMLPSDPLVEMLPAVTLAVVVMLAVVLIALTTLPLKLNPVAFKFPPVTLPVAVINPAVVKFPPTTLPVALRVTPCTKATLITLPPRTFPVASTPAAVLMCLWQLPGQQC
jgi:hypothetical protein